MSSNHSLEDSEPVFSWIISALQDDGKTKDLSDLVALKVETDRLIKLTADRIISEMDPSYDRRTLELFSEMYRS